MMNNAFVMDQASYLAHRTEVEGTASDEARITALYRLAYERQPSADELSVAMQFIHSNVPSPEVQPAAADPWHYGFGLYGEKENALSISSGCRTSIEARGAAARRRTIRSSADAALIRAAASRGATAPARPSGAGLLRAPGKSPSPRRSACSPTPCSPTGRASAEGSFRVDWVSWRLDRKWDRRTDESLRGRCQVRRRHRFHRRISRRTGSVWELLLGARAEDGRRRQRFVVETA